MLVSEFVAESCSTNLTARRIAVDRFNKYVFVCIDDEVRMFDLTTGNFLSTLKHDSIAVSVDVYHGNFLQILTCTDTGDVSLWNYEEGTRLKTWNISCHVDVYLPCKRPNSLGFVVKPTEKKTHELCEISLPPPGDDPQLKNLVDDVPNSYKKFSCSHNGSFVAFVDSCSLNVCSVGSGKRPIKHWIGGDKQFECVRFHPSENFVATGDNIGRVVIWHDFMYKRPVQTIFHWHATPVTDIDFPTEGSSMYTSGNECVVVKWSLQSSQKEQTKEFLPRLGANVVSLTCSPDNTNIFATLDDNSIQVASNQMQLVGDISGFTSCYGPGSSNIVGLKFDSVGLIRNRTKNTLVTTSRPGHIQFYDPIMDRQTYNLDVVGRNLPPQEATTFSHVIHVDFIHSWMATVEYRDEPLYTKDFALKFWHYDQVSEKLDLALTVDNPCFQVISGIRFRPCDQTAMAENENDQELCLVTSSLDGSVNSWVLTECKTQLTWLCTKTTTYRNRPAHCCQFNPSGKVLAVGYNCALTFWRFDDDQLLLAMRVLDEPDFLKCIEFGVGKQSKLVCLLSHKGHCSVWDVDEQVQIWRHDRIVSAFALNVPSDLFAVALSEGGISLYRFSSMKHMESLTDSNKAPFKALVFDSSFESYALNYDLDKYTTSVLYGLTQDQSIWRIGTKQRLNFLRGLRIKAREDSSVPKSSLAKFLIASKSQTPDDQKTISVDTRYLDQKANAQILNAPAHTLPDIDMLGARFLESCLQPKVQNQQFSTLADSAKPPGSFFPRNTTQAVHKQEAILKKQRDRLKKCDFSILESFFAKF